MRLRRNVLLVTLDQWRADALGAAGNAHIRTPHLDRLARQGALFRNHFTQASPCGPARASLLTGLYQHNTQVLRNGSPLAADVTNIALESRRAGYDPALFGYTDSTPDPRGRDPADPALHSYEGVMPGFTPELLLPTHERPWLAHLQEAGYRFDDVADALSPAGAPGGRPTGAAARYQARHSRSAFLTDAVLRYLSGRHAQSWFAHVCYIAPHPPFVAPAPFHAMYRPADMPPCRAAADAAAEARQHKLLAHYLRRQQRRSFFAGTSEPVSTLSAADFAQLRATYCGMVSEVDTQLGRLVGQLDQWSLLDETLIVITGDHGEMLGDHWMLGKEGYFAEAYHVPLIIRAPGPAAAQEIAAFTEAVDVMPTILEWIGVPPPPRRDGRSLLAFCRGQATADWREAAHWEFDFSGAERQLGLAPGACALAVRRDARFHYVHFAALPPLLFDLARDPACLDNVAEAPQYAAAALACARALLSWRMASSSGVLSHLLVTPDGLQDRTAAQPR